MKKRLAFIMALLLIVTCTGCGTVDSTGTTLLCKTEGTQWHFGFGSAQFQPDESSEQPLYIAGYDPGREVTDVLDYCQARAVWMDTGNEGVLLIGIDCVALDSGTVAKIRQAVADIPAASVNVFSTHTHAGADTLGMWGKIGIDGKNDAYMESLQQAAEQAARAAVADRRAGTLHFGHVKTEGMLRDSRLPVVTDENLYQLRFAAADGTAGVRMLFYGAHPEALRGANTMLSRDFAGLLCDGVTEATGDDTMFLPGAIGGLVMTRDFVEIGNDSNKAQENLQITADKLIEFTLSIDEEEIVAPQMALARTVFCAPLDNIIFLTYKFLGILNHKAMPADSTTGYGVVTELSVLKLGDIAVTLLPGEIFPELVNGEAYGRANPPGVNPKPLQQLAKEQGIEKMLIVGLSNDEIGYIVPPSDFMLNPDRPYLDRYTDYKGEDHYEETNSVGPACAQAIADAFAATVMKLAE